MDEDQSDCRIIAIPHHGGHYQVVIPVQVNLRNPKAAENANQNQEDGE